MNRLEKGIFIGVLAIFVLLPVTILGYNVAYFALKTGQYGNIALVLSSSLAAVTVMSLITMAAVLIKKICSVCINFSCPLNHVEKSRLDAYLKQNPDIKKAWEEKGYQTGKVNNE